MGHNDLTSDGEIIAASLSIRSDAFSALVVRHADPVFGYLARRTDRERAADLSNEVWMRAFRDRRNFDQRYDSAIPWLLGIARNVLAAHLRSRYRESDPPPFELPAIADKIVESDERMDAQWLLAKVRDRMMQLGPEDREVLLLLAWEQLSPAEIAVALNIPAGTVRSRLFRIRRFLRSEVDDTTTRLGTKNDGGVAL